MLAVLTTKFSFLILILLHPSNLQGFTSTHDQEELNTFTRSFNISLKSSRLNKICEIDIESSTGAMIEAYFENSNSYGVNMKIRKIFSISRKYERDNYAHWVNLDDIEEGSRLLVWHGTRIKNLQAILEDGFQLPDSWDLDGSQFVLTMHSLFGPGIFFADRSSKSAAYTDKFGTGVLLLCEVALGKTLKAAYPHDFSHGPNEYDSVMGVGKKIPHRNGTVKFEDAYVPAGKTIQHPEMSPTMRGHPYHNEYVVFDTTRILIKFIVQIERK